MKLVDVRNKAIAIYNSRELKDLRRRMNAVESVSGYLLSIGYGMSDEFPTLDKEVLKNKCRDIKGSELSGAENSVINEFYKQSALHSEATKL